MKSKIKKPRAKKRECSLDQEIDKRIAELERGQVDRAKALQTILDHAESILLKAAPRVVLAGSAMEFASMAKAHATLTTTQRLCAGLDTEKVNHTGTLSVTIIRRGK